MWHKWAMHNDNSAAGCLCAFSKLAYFLFRLNSLPVIQTDFANKEALKVSFTYVRAVLHMIEFEN